MCQLLTEGRLIASSSYLPFLAFKDRPDDDRFWAGRGHLCICLWLGCITVAGCCCSYAIKPTGCAPHDGCVLLCVWNQQSPCLTLLTMRLHQCVKPAFLSMDTAWSIILHLMSYLFEEEVYTMTQHKHDSEQAPIRRVCARVRVYSTHIIDHVGYYATTVEQICRCLVAPRLVCTDLHGSLVTLGLVRTHFSFVCRMMSCTWS